jgi:hypothetical protein
MEMFGADIAGHSGVQLSDINSVDDAVTNGANIAKVCALYCSFKCVPFSDNPQIHVK